MTLTSQLGITNSRLKNIELGIGATPFVLSATAAPIFIGSVQNRFSTIKATHRATPQLLTYPDSFDVATSETFPYAVDVSNYMGTGDIITSVGGIMTEIATGKTVSASVYGTVTTSGNIITIPINCSFLRLGVQYESVITFTANAAKVLSYVSTFHPLATTTTAGVSGSISSLGQANQLTTKPGFFTIASNETSWPYMVDVTNYLSSTDVIVNPVAAMSLSSNGGAVTSAWQIGSPQVVGNVVIFYINVSKLAIGQSYQIVVSFTANTNKVVAYSSTLRVTT